VFGVHKEVWVGKAGKIWKEIWKMTKDEIKKAGKVFTETLDMTALLLTNHGHNWATHSKAMFNKAWPWSAINGVTQ
jgi:hypothetical protein